MRSQVPALALLPLLALAACGDGPGAGGRYDPDGPAPTPEERLRDWEELPAGTGVPVALGFGAVLPDSVVAAMLQRHGLRPYRVLVRTGGMSGSHRVDRAQASLEVLGLAREEVLVGLRTSMCAQQGRARAMLAQPAAPEPDLVRATLSRFLRLQRSLPDIQRGAPIVYGVEAVGTLPDVRAAASDPAVRSFEPGWRGRVRGEDTVIVPDPPAPTETGPGPLPEIVALDAEALSVRLRELAEGGAGECQDGLTPDDPSALERIPEGRPDAPPPPLPDTGGVPDGSGAPPG